MNPISKRYLCIYLPMWAVNLAQRSLARSQHAQSPILLSTTHAQQLIVKQCCMQAQRQGVRRGMPLAVAKALCPEACNVAFEALRNATALRKLCVRALKFSPLVGVETEFAKAEREGRMEQLDPIFNGLVLDLTGTTRLHRDERILCERIMARLHTAGITTRIATASTIGAAWALSRYAPSAITIASEHAALRSLLRDLPVEALRLSPESAAAFHALGIYSIGELLKLPKKQLAIRFGTGVLHRIDQAFGAVEEGFETVQAPDSIRAQRSFEEPLTNQQAIKTAALLLFEAVFRELLKRRKRAGAFTLVLHGRNEHYEPFSRSKDFFLHAATKSFQHVASVIDPVIGNLVIPGGVHGIALLAHDVELTHDEQMDFLSPADLHFLLHSGREFLNSLSVRLGSNRVRTVSFRNSYIPERSFNYLPLERSNSSRQSARQPQLLCEGRPPYLLSRPEPVTALAMLPDSPPLRLSWKGKELQILHGNGPERISPEWWQLNQYAAEEEREYFKLQDHLGRWLWVFRERNSMRWFVHGVWG